MAVKTILFVTYGGGHGRMIVPVVQALSEDKDIRCVCLALTTAAPLFQNAGLPHLGYKDFITPDDEAAWSWGKALALKHHTPESGMEEAESVAYLGLCYAELVARHGEEEAARLWQEKGRHAFYPNATLRRVIDQVKPHLIVATNSPRSEKAALDVGLERGIPTLCMIDLLGYIDFHIPAADYFTVLSDKVIGLLQEGGVRAPREHFFVTGNPAFDNIIDYSGPVDMGWRAQHFPDIPSDAKTVVWIDMPGYFRGIGNMRWRDAAEVRFDLDNFAHATKEAGAYALIRPHPSQGHSFHRQWAKNAGAHVRFAGDVPLYPLLNAADAVAVYASTVTLESVLMRRKVIQLLYFPEENGMPMAKWDLAWPVTAPDKLGSIMKEALYNEADWARKLDNIQCFSQPSKATGRVTECIRKLL